MLSYIIIYWLLGIILLPGIIFASWASIKVNKTYRAMRNLHTKQEKTADVVAREILDKNGLENITIGTTPGEMTDHYDPKKNHISLSQGVYGSNSVAALGIAAHEVGHAIQRKEGNFAAKLRTILVPLINFCSVALWPLVIIGMFINIGASFQSLIGEIFMWIGISFFALSVLFSLITLPTELDASKRAINQLKDGGYLADDAEISGAQSVLKAAAMTYVASLVISVLNMVRFLLTLFVIRNE